MKKLKGFLEKNKLFIAIMLIGIILLFVQMNQVVMYADDFSIGVEAKSKDTNIFQHFINHYKTWGGGYTGCLVIILIHLGFNVWKVTNTLLITLIVFFGTKMITFKNEKYKNIVAIILWACVFSLGIYVSRECIYWMDGSTAYVLSTFLMFTFIYVIYSKLIMKIRIRKVDYILLPFLGLFAGWSSAQTGIISLCIAFILIGYSKFKKKDKIQLVVWIALIFCIIGCLIFYLSPGNFGRMQAFEEYAELNIGQKILYRAKSVYGLLFDFKSYEPYEMPFYFILLIRFNFNCSNTIDK